MEQRPTSGHAPHIPLSRAPLSVYNSRIAQCAFQGEDSGSRRGSQAPARRARHRPIRFGSLEARKPRPGERPAARLRIEPRFDLRGVIGFCGALPSLFVRPMPLPFEPTISSVTVFVLAKGGRRSRSLIGAREQFPCESPMVVLRIYSISGRF